MTTIESLFSIPDIFFEILKKLTPEDLIVQSFVCKKWYQFCSDDYLWALLFRETNWTVSPFMAAMHKDMKLREILEANKGKLIGRKFNWKKIFLRRFSVQVTEFYQSFSEWGLKGLVEFFLRFYVNPDRIYINKKRLLDHYYGGYNYTLPCAMIQLGAISEMPQLNAFMNDWIIKPCYICNPEKKAMSDIVKEIVEESEKSGRSIAFQSHWETRELHLNNLRCIHKRLYGREKQPTYPLTTPLEPKKSIFEWKYISPIREDDDEDDDYDNWD